MSNSHDSLVRTVAISPPVAAADASASGLSDIANNSSLINVAKVLVIRHSRLLAITAAVAAFAWVVTSSSTNKGRRSKRNSSKKAKKASSSSSNTPSRKTSAKSTPTHTPPLSRSAATSSPNSPLFNLKSGGVSVSFKNSARKVSSSSSLLHDDDHSPSSTTINTSSSSSEIPATTATPSLATTPATLQDSSTSVDVRLASAAATKVAVNSSSPSPLTIPPKKSVVTTTATTTDNESATALLLQGNPLPPTPPAYASTDEDTELGFWDDESPFVNNNDKTPTSDTVSSATSTTIAAKPVAAAPQLPVSPSHAVKSASPLGQSVITAGSTASLKQSAGVWFQNSAELSVHDSKQLVFKVDAQREPPFPLAYSTSTPAPTTTKTASPPVTAETKTLTSVKPETLPSSTATLSACKPSLSWFTEMEASQMPTLLVSAEPEFPFSMAYSTAIAQSSTTAPSHAPATAAAPVKKQIVPTTSKKQTASDAVPASPEKAPSKSLSWFTIVETSVTPYASQLSFAEREFPFPMEYSRAKKKDQESSMQEDDDAEEFNNVEVVIGEETTEKTLLLVETQTQESVQSTYELASEELVEESVETEGTALEEEDAAEFETLTVEVDEKESAAVQVGGDESEMASPETVAASLNPAVVEFVPISAVEMSGNDSKFNLEVPEFVPGEAVVSEDQFGLAVPDFVPSQSSDGIVFYPSPYDAVYNPYNNQQIIDPVYDASYDQQQNVDPLYNPYSQQVADLVDGSTIEAPNGDEVFNPYAAPTDAIYNPYERPPAIFDGVVNGGSAFNGNQYDVNAVPYYSPGTAVGYSLMVDPNEAYPEGGFVAEYSAAEYNQQQSFNYSKQRGGKRHSHIHSNNGRGNGSQRHSTSSNHHHNHNHDHSRSSTNNDCTEYIPQAYNPRGEHRSKSHQHSRAGTAGSGTGGDGEYSGNRNGYRTRGGLSHKSSTTSLHSNGTGGGSSGHHSRSHSHRNGRREEEQHHHAPTLADFIKVAVKKEAKQVNHGVNSDAGAGAAVCVSEAARIDDVTVEGGGDAEGGVPVEGATTATPAPSTTTTKKSPNVLNRDVVKCIYGSSCVNSKCSYFHPSEVCKFFPNCKYGNNCLFIHKPVATSGSSATTTITTTTTSSATE